MRTLSVFIFILTTLLATQTQAEKLSLVFFGSSTCGECLQIKEKLLKPMMNKYPDELEIQILDT